MSHPWPVVVPPPPASTFSRPYDGTLRYCSRRPEGGGNVREKGNNSLMPSTLAPQRTKHKLQNRWGLFASDRSDDGGLKETDAVHTFGTVEDFWSVFHYTRSVAELQGGYGLFKQGSYPCTDSKPFALGGGRWVCRFERKAPIEELWCKVVLGLIGEYFEMVGEVLHGKLTNKRPESCAKEWLAESVEEDENNVSPAVNATADVNGAADVNGSGEGSKGSADVTRSIGRQQYNGRWGQIVFGATAKVHIDGQHCIELWLNAIEQTTATVIGKALEDLLVPIAYPQDGMLFEPFNRSALSPFRLTTKLLQARPVESSDRQGEEDNKVKVVDSYDFVNKLS
eukprot:GHVS01014746.1.p1 GENE.GHVS01014746.1~~GHVS01014746.1.p1  ORF type:complete len:339 (+),score=60.66 GHVS01014746.1:62-1078(+)